MAVVLQFVFPRIALANPCIFDVAFIACFAIADHESGNKVLDMGGSHVYVLYPIFRLCHGVHVAYPLRDSLHAGRRISPVPGCSGTARLLRQVSEVTTVSLVAFINHSDG